jgi:hypothetical protein
MVIVVLVPKELESSSSLPPLLVPRYNQYWLAPPFQVKVCVDDLRVEPSTGDIIPWSLRGIEVSVRQCVWYA